MRVRDRAGGPKVAIVKLSSLGDVIHALPVARALRRECPDAELTWIVEVRESALLERHPDLDAVVPVDTRRWRALVGHPGRLRLVLREFRALARRLREARFDVALDLQGLIKSAAVMALTRAPVRIGPSLGWSREWLGAFCANRRVTPPAGAVHVVDQYLSFLAPLGIQGGPPEFFLPAREEQEQRAEDFLAECGIKPRDRVVALNPGAGRLDKRWPVSHFRRLAERLFTEGGARILLLWGPGEIHTAREIGDGLGARPVLAPPTDLHELASLLRRCSLMVSGDTGPLHLAAALGTPCLGLFGPTRAERNGPYGPRCRGLQSPDGTMPALHPDVALVAALDLLEQGGGAR